MSGVSAFGISAAIPAGWEARIFRHVGGEATLHAASFPLPTADGEFGTRATKRMPHEALFLSLTEYKTGKRLDVKRGLFANPPPLDLEAAHFSPRALLHARPGQRGLQRFFSASGRAFCLYVVVTSPGRMQRRLATAAHLLHSLEISERG